MTTGTRRISAKEPTQYTLPDVAPRDAAAEHAAWMRSAELYEEARGLELACDVLDGCVQAHVYAKVRALRRSAAAHVPPASWRALRAVRCDDLSPCGEGCCDLEAGHDGAHSDGDLQIVWWVEPPEGHLECEFCELQDATVTWVDELKSNACPSCAADYPRELLGGDR